jgi:hypothetical protein
VFADQLGVGRPHVHADHLEGSTAPTAHFFGEKRLHGFLGSIFPTHNNKRRSRS